MALHISKAFDNVWLACLLHKSKGHGVFGQIFDLIQYLLNHVMKVVLRSNAFRSYHTNTNDHPPGCILGPTLFLININDFPNLVFMLMSQLSTSALIVSFIK